MSREEASGLFVIEVESNLVRTGPSLHRENYTYIIPVGPFKTVNCYVSCVTVTGTQLMFNVCVLTRMVLNSEKAVLCHERFFLVIFKFSVHIFTE